MSAFPKLKTGAVAQYPAMRSVAYATEVLRFADGSEQRYRLSGAPARRWAIRLELLDDGELARLSEFFQSVEGRCGSFSFEDPWDGTTYADCSLDSDELVADLVAEGRASTLLVVRQNRS